MRTFEALEHPVCFSQPARLADSAWIEHIPFGMYLVAALQPRVLVELGTNRGTSYCAFCQAVRELALHTRCYAVDTWAGDPQSGAYGPEVLAELHQHHDPLYGAFSQLLSGEFNTVAHSFDSGSIDLCHIDGYHVYEAVKNDFETWLPKMSPRGVVVLHDTNLRERDFGVWKLWQELQSCYPHFEMVHGYGLGVLAVGGQIPPGLEPLFQATSAEVLRIRQFFFQLGMTWQLWKQLQTTSQSVQNQAAAVAELRAALETQQDTQRRLEVGEKMALAQQLGAASQTVQQQSAALAELRAGLEQKGLALQALTAAMDQQRAEHATALNAALARQTADQNRWDALQQSHSYRLARTLAKIKDGLTRQ